MVSQVLQNLANMELLKVLQIKFCNHITAIRRIPVKFPDLISFGVSPKPSILNGHSALPTAAEVQVPVQFDLKLEFKRHDFSSSTQLVDFPNPKC